MEDPITCEKPDGSRQGGVLGCGLGLGRAPLFWVLGLGIFLGILIPPGIPVPVLFTESIQTFFIISVLSNTRKCTVDPSNTREGLRRRRRRRRRLENT